MDEPSDVRTGVWMLLTAAVSAAVVAAAVIAVGQPLIHRWTAEKLASDQDLVLVTD